MRIPVTIHERRNCTVPNHETGIDLSLLSSPGELEILYLGSYTLMALLLLTDAVNEPNSSQKGLRGAVVSFQVTCSSPAAILT